ncbi:nucleotide exchange factor GrpE [Halothermothrix orenii]|uniref:Protein GrpE n=1 Tax=Halothermothrix orenii (strain H 168 / OCM 544 / DSM 9562) TaxID=373903 RepID=B8CXL2_HALOH|nr:nucleotide exchange factor GrpE [Halothermothrix orenii]ACL70031.1 GrpE protein [Halothermothrix orenii H 168]
MEKEKHVSSNEEFNEKEEKNNVETVRNNENNDQEVENNDESIQIDNKSQDRTNNKEDNGDNKQEQEDKNGSDEDIKHLKERVKELETEVDELTEEKNNIFNKLQRLQADFINYRKRTNKEKGKIGIRAKIELIEKILPVVDNFERALNSAPDEDEFKQGVDMIYRQLMDTLKKEGVEVIPAVGEPFDHNLHEAIMQVEDSKYESGTVVEELQKGYILEDKVIRPAMVKVAK